MLLLCFLFILAQENHCFYNVCLAYATKTIVFLLSLFSIGQENQCFYSVFGTTSPTTVREHIFEFGAVTSLPLSKL